MSRNVRERAAGSAVRTSIPARRPFRWVAVLLSLAFAIPASKLLAGAGPVGVYAPLTVAVACAAWFAGPWAALLCQVCCAAVAFGFIARAHPFDPVRISDLYGLLCFLVAGKIALFLAAHTRWTLGLRRSERNLRLVATATNDSIWEWDLVAGTVQRTGNLQGIYGGEEAADQHEPTWWRDRIHPDDRADIWDDIQRALVNGDNHWSKEYRIRQNSGDYILVLDRATIVRNRAGRAVRMIGGLSDITARQRAQEKLAYNALHDPLTGLPNRTCFREELARRMAKRNDAHLAVLFLDLDRFKAVNDSLGHAAGDTLLRAVSQRIGECLRPGEVAARFGGDEFTILLEGMTSARDAISMADRLKQALSVPYELEGHSFVVSSSIGIAFANEGLYPEEILRHADVAMYRAKARGRARCEIFESQLDAPRMNLLQIESELRKSFIDGDFRLHYQPIVSLPDGEIQGFEALLRWLHPRRGLLLPEEFLSVAEESGFITELGRWVLKESCRQLSCWHKTMPSAHSLTINVNIAEPQFADPHLYEYVESDLAASGLTGRSLVLELTENIISESAASVLGRLHQLRRLGVQFAIDDFGKGHSSFARLHELPISILKIDGAFTGQIMTGKPALVDAIVAMCQQLGLSVVAECVETKKQYEHLKAVRCTGAQGSFFAPALDARTCTELLAAGGQWTAAMGAASGHL